MRFSQTRSVYRLDWPLFLLFAAFVLLTWWIVMYFSMEDTATRQSRAALATTPTFAQSAEASVQALARRMGVQVDYHRVVSDCTTRNPSAWTVTFGGPGQPVLLGYCASMTGMSSSAFKALMAHELAHLQYPTPRAPYFWLSALGSSTLLLIALLAPYRARRRALPYPANATGGLFLASVVLHAMLMLDMRLQAKPAEYHADAIAAQLTSPAAVIDALRFIAKDKARRGSVAEQSRSAATHLHDWVTGDWFSDTHPSFDGRIKRLQAMRDSPATPASGEQ